MGPGLAIYLNKYLVNHIFGKDLKGKRLQEKPVSSNIKNVQILDYYINELLVENTNSYTLNYEKVLKGIQEKVMAIFPPLIRLWHITEEKK